MEEKSSEKKEREMRDSGIPWIGEVPEGWGFPKITHILDYTHPYPIGDGDHGSIKATDYTEHGIPFIRVQNLGFATDLCLDNVVYISEAQNRTIQNSTLKPNDILFAKTGATIGKVGIVPESIKKANTTSHVGKITVSESIIPKYIFYVLSSNIGYRQFWDIAAQKSTRPELSIDEIKTIRVLLPKTKEEQQRIADYLDSKCSEIDTIIENLRTRMESVKEYKKAVITEAVTKGLDKDVKMKDSGVEWIGKIPEGWKVCKVKQISNKITDGAHVSPDTTNGEFKFLSVTNMNDTGALDFVNCLKINSVQYAYLVRTGCQPKKDDVLISKDGTIGKTTVVSDNNFVVASSLVIIRPNQLKIRPKYLKYCLMSNIVQEQLLSVLAGSALKRASIEKNANLKFVYTYDMTTQQQIIDYLDSKCSEIDTLLQNYEDQIATLEEYKKSLIYEYVTGKKEVPEA